MVHQGVGSPDPQVSSNRHMAWEKAGLTAATRFTAEMNGNEGSSGSRPKCYAQLRQDALCTGELQTLGSPSMGTEKPLGQEVLWMLWKCSNEVEEMGER